VNDFTEVPNDLNRRFEQLKVLSVASNRFQEWSEVRKLGKLFPNLVSLNLSENPLQRITIDSNCDREFCELERLNVMETKIDNWESIDNLRNLPKLTELRIKGSPIYSGKSLTEKQHRLLTVARLPKLIKLNASPIEDEEREDGERMYIRFHMQSEQKPKRYEELISEHGKLDVLAEVNFDRSSIVNVVVKGDVDAPFLHQLDISQSVNSLYKDLSTKLKIKKEKLRLIHVEQDNPDSFYVGTVIEGKGTRVSRYYVREGDFIKVVRLDLNIE